MKQHLAQHGDVYGSILGAAYVIFFTYCAVKGYVAFT